MDIRKFLELLTDNGFTFLRNGNGSHQIWINANGNVFRSLMASPYIRE